MAPLQRLRSLRAAVAPHERGAAATSTVVVDSTKGWPTWLPEPEYTHVPRFPFDTVRGRGEAMAHLQEEGYAVVRDVLSIAECKRALDMLWSEVEAGGSGIRRGEFATWGDDSAFGNNWGHSDFLWHVRGLPRVKQVWELACHTDDLLVSFDGCSLYRPWGLNEAWNANAMGLHTDRRNHAGIPDGYVQGFVNLISTTPQSGGNVIVPRSHKLIDELEATIRPQLREGQSFYAAVAEHRPEVFDQNVIIAHVEAGDVFLWLDTTIHCRAGGVGTGPTEPSLIRAAVYVTMSPKANATPETLRQRELAVVTNHGNGHTAHHPLSTGMSGRQSKDLSVPREGVPEWGGLESLSPSQRALIS